MNTTITPLKVALTLALGVTAVFTVRHFSKQTIPTADEFFEQNPHLTRTEPRMSPEPDALRKEETFQAGDFQLQKGRIYPIDFKSELKANLAGKKSIDNRLTGEIRMKSLGLKKGRLLVIAEFFFKESQGFEKLSARGKQELGLLQTLEKTAKKDDKKTEQKNDPRLYRSLLLKLDPRGILKELYAVDEKSDPTTIEARLGLLDSIFRKVEPIRVGNRIVKEPDPIGIPYEVKYEISSGQNDETVIQASAEVNSATDPIKNKSKMALAGLSALDNVMFKTTVSQKLNWTWMNSEQRPRVQSNLGLSEMFYENRLIASVGSMNLFTWNAFLTDTPDDEREAKLKYPVNIEAARARIRNKRTIKTQEETGKFDKSFEVLARDLDKVDKPNFSADETDATLTGLSLALKYNPALVGRAKDMAFSAAPGSDKVSVILGAMGYDMAPWTQKAMIDIFNRPNATEEEKLKVVTHFIMSNHPLTESSKEFIKKQYTAADPLTSRIAMAAGLAVGSSIRHDGDPRNVKILKDDWNKYSGNERGQAYILSAVGNSKSNVFLPEVKEAANSGSVPLIKGAADAVRFTQDVSSRELLFTKFFTHSNREVRMAAVDALQYQPFDDRTRTALMSCASSDPYEGVKILCYRYLGGHILEPGIREYLNGRLNSEAGAVQKEIRVALSIKESK